ncbi:MAG: PHB depolymerase family esterase [Alteraurantiacibacter sp.]
MPRAGRAAARTAMTAPLNASMKEILALTKAGRLGDATAMIQRSLGAGESPGSADIVDLDAAALPHPTTIEGKARRANSAPVASGRATRRSFANAQGKLAYRLYVPAKPLASPPLVVMLHGCTQSAEDFARGTQMDALAEEGGFIVAYPEQTQAANQQKCWNWFRPSDQKRGSGEPAVIAGIVEEIVAEHNVDPSRVYVAGLSAGGAAAAIMAAGYPDIFAAVGVHSGLACGSAQDLPSAFAAMQGRGKKRRGKPVAFVPIITLHGDRDSTVHPDNSEQIHAALSASPQLAGLLRTEQEGVSLSGRRYRRIDMVDKAGRSFSEDWQIAGAGHAWSGGSPDGSYTEPDGPNASREMVRFFMQHQLG